MRSDHPPSTAKWLLRHFGSSPNNDAVIGDLEERFRHHRSALWYWKQVFTALVAGFFQELGRHKFLAVRVVIFGIILLHLVANTMFNLFGRLVAGTVHTEGMKLWIYVAFAAVVWLAGAASGWIMARFNRDYERAVTPLYASSVALYLLASAIAVGIGQGALSVGGSPAFYSVNSAILVTGILLGGTVLSRSGGIHFCSQ